MKKRILRFCSLFLALSLLISTRSYATCESYSWCVKRNGNEQPIFPKELARVEDYGAYYLDKSAEDGSCVRKIYLTFDAGYENGNIEKILNVMKEKNVTGAFFILDNLIIKEPELIKRMKSEGHLVCNHTKNHKNLSGATKEEIENDLTALESLCLERCGIELDKYFRFPEGKFSINALKSVSELGYKTVFWSFAYDDWDNARQPSEKAAIKKILSNTHDGAVILLHPTSTTNANILSHLIDEWRKMGYSFGTLDDLTK